MSSELNPDLYAAPAGGEGDYISYSEMLQRLALRYPEVPMAAIESIARDEHDVITDGVPYLVPRLVEIGTLERLDAFDGRSDG